MKTAVFSWEDVSRLLPMGECIEVMRSALGDLSRGDSDLPLRQVSRTPDGLGALASMPAFLRVKGMLGVKVISVFTGNRETKYDSHQGAVLLFESINGRLLGIFDAGSITAIRTAAVSAVATDLLANKDAQELAILGSGTQASTHVSSMTLVRNIKKIRVWSRNQDHSKRFVRNHDVAGADVVAVPTAEEAVKQADIICTTTASRSPVLMGSWLSPGAHVNAVGASVPPYRELDTEAVRISKLFVDRRESALKEAAEYLIPREEGAISEGHIAGELGELLLGKVIGRRSANEVTLFKSLGLAVEDLAAAHHIYMAALKNRSRNEVEFNSARNEG